MINNFKPYGQYKPTGLSWLNSVPTHWDIRRNGRLFGIRKETGFVELPILEVSIRSGVRLRDQVDRARKQEMTDRSKYQRAVRGDTAYNMMRMWQGAVGVVPTDGLVSPAYVVAHPYHDVEPRYFTYLFRTSTYMREVDTFSRGIVPDRNRLYWEAFKQMPSIVPPYNEQILIARFLDVYSSRVNYLLRAKLKLIALLSQQKLAIVNRAATRGLGPNIRLKSSGVEWLGNLKHPLISRERKGIVEHPRLL
jgi:type I restriction enzyme, S subunit